MTVNPNQLAKLLQLTESSFDAEAMTAMKKANALLKASGLLWKDVIRIPIITIKPIWERPKQPSYEEFSSVKPYKRKQK